MTYATSEVNDVSPVGTRAESGLAMPRWSWSGRIDETDEEVG
jgi:hypothetical protein